jgi:Cu(I)/Ag(I) efflux system periplasmic protein CusF
MKQAIFLTVLIAIAPSTLAQSGGMKGMDMKDMPMKGMDKKGSAHKATGVVTKMEKDKVTIRHEPVASLNWPPMTMAFTVKDKALMDKMKNGQKVDFEFVQEGRDYVVTGVK